MSSSSVSFRITRHTEDLAETLHALSQRLVAMEQRLGALELQLTALRQQPQEDPSEITHLAEAEAHIERLLLDCRELLSNESGMLRESGVAADLEGVGSSWRGPDTDQDEDLHQAA